MLVLFNISDQRELLVVTQIPASLSRVERMEFHLLLMFLGCPAGAPEMGIATLLPIKRSLTSFVIAGTIYI